MNNKQPSYHSQKKYLNKQSAFRIYYEKQEHDAIKKKIDSTGYTPKQIFEMGLQALDEKMNFIDRLSKLFGTDPETMKSNLRKGMKKKK